MSTLITLSGESSELSVNFDPAIILDDEHDYVIGLLAFQSYNSIPNILPPNNTFDLYGLDPIELETGAYEINDLNTVINSKLSHGDYVTINGNNSTMKTLIYATRWIDFSSNSSIGPQLGFQKKQYEPNKWHESENIPKIMTINSIMLHCNLAMNSYMNGQPGHIIFNFCPAVPAGYKIVVAPDPIVYLPINRKTITSITVKVTDQDLKPVSFRGETVTISLHLKKV